MIVSNKVLAICIQLSVTSLSAIGLSKMSMHTPSFGSTGNNDTLQLSHAIVTEF